MTAHEELEEIRREIAGGNLELPETSPFPFSRVFPQVRFLTKEEVGRAGRWFFLGDIHGDFLALHHQLTFIAAAEPDFRAVLLGDIPDRGSCSAECFLLLLRRARQFPGQIYWIAGNHDTCFSVADGKFASSVEPAEFLDFLNGGPEEERPRRRRIGECFMRFAELLPRALVFPDGLLATHGGFPLGDLQAKIPAGSPFEEVFAWINRPEFLQDFTWTRLTRYKRKQPNRERKGCSYGYEDFEAFCRLFPDAHPVRRMITGHEHFDEGWVEHPAYKVNPAATITGFGFPAMGAVAGSNYRNSWFVARHREGALPEPLEILVPEPDRLAFYPLPKKPTTP